MTAKIPEHMLCSLSEFIGERFGLDFPRERWPYLATIVSSSHHECRNQDGTEDYIRALVSSRSTQRQLDSLIQHMTVGETYFLRENKALEVLSEQIVPDVLQGRRAVKPVRILSAGCATGEEPYSVAISLRRAYPNLGDGSVNILATDLNVRSLEKAVEGIYGKWSFRGAPEWLRNLYFEALPKERWSISPLIRSMVNFKRINLLEDGALAGPQGTQEFDAVLCRNVLMYFTSGAMKKVIHQFYQCLTEGGYLIVGAAETSATLFPGFAPVTVDGVTVYRKQSTQPQTADDRIPSSYQADQREIQVTHVANPTEKAIQGLFCESESEDLAGAQQPERCQAPTVSYERALMLYRLDKYEDAEQMCIALLSEYTGDPPVQLLLARIYANLGKLTAALDCCEKALAADKMAAPAHYLRALILVEQGKFDDAAESLKSSIYVDPNFVLSHFTMGNLALRHGTMGDPGKHFENTLLLLAQLGPDNIVPESDGLSVSELRKIVLRLRAKTGQPAASHRSSSRYSGAQRS